MSNLTLIADEENIRIDRYLSLHSDLSRSFLQKLSEEGKILVNGKPVKSSYKTVLNDEIVVEVPEMQNLEALPENIPLDILYEDSDLIVINKPKGMVVHPASGNYSHTLVNALAVASGVVCDGAKASCAAKIALAVENGLFGYEMWKNGNEFMGGDGIIKKGSDNVVKNVGRLASRGMKETDKEILQIMLTC